MSKRMTGAVALALIALGLLWWRAGGGGPVEPIAPMGLAPERAASADPATPPERAVDEQHAATRSLAAEPAEVEPAPAAAELATLTVLVRSKQTGLPIEGARVSVFVQDPARKGGVRFVDSTRGSADESPLSGVDGRALFELPPGFPADVLVRGEASPAGTANLELEPLAPGEARELVVELDTDRAIPLHGLVLERATRAPIAGARVTLGTTPQRSGEARAVSDAGGRFLVEYGAFERAPLCVDARGYGFALVPVQAGRDTPERALEILLERGASLSVTLLDSSDGPIADAFVRLSTAMYELAQHRVLSDSVLYDDARWKARTDASGRVRFDELPARAPLTLEAFVENQPLTGAPEPLRLEPGEARALEWRVGAGARVAVLALDPGAGPIEGLELALERAKWPRPYFLNDYTADERRLATTDAEGRARFEDVPAGEWAVGPAPEPRHARTEGAAAPLAELVSVPAVGEVDVELRVERGLWIGGRVLTPDGELSPAAFVEAYQESSKLLIMGQPDGETGAFAAGPLVPGSWRLVASGRPHAPSEPLVVEAGATGVELHLREGAAVLGVVLDGATSRPARAKVGIASAGAAEGVRMGTSARDGGEFEFRGLTPGEYDLVASGAGGLFALARNVRAEPGAEPARVELRLEPGAVVRVHFEGPAQHASVELRSEGAVCALDGVRQGGELLLTGPSGRCTLIVRMAPDRVPHEREVELAPGDELELTFDGEWR